MYLADFHNKLIIELKKNEVEFILIGSHAAIFYGSDRTTGDMDLLVKPSFQNGFKIITSFKSLNLDIDDLLPEDFEKNLVLNFGFEPECVDINNFVKVLDFETIEENSQVFAISGNIIVQVIGVRDLLMEKQHLKLEG